jgi:oligoendopeptidase F
MVLDQAAPTWDLSDLYQGPDDPHLHEAFATLLQRATDFETHFRGRIADANCTVETLRAALDEYEAICRSEALPLAFASLRFAADTSDPARGALLQKLQVESTAVANHLIFFELEIGRIPEETFARLSESPLLAPYRYYLDRERRAAAHSLSEPEEKVCQELSNTGVRAFIRLFSELTSRAVYRVEGPGERQELSQSQVMALFYDSDRAVRQAAAAAVTATLQSQAHPLTFIYNTLVQERATVDRLRGYGTPEAFRHEANDLDAEVVACMVEACVAGYPVVQDYYGLKRRLLGLDELRDYDRYAPLAEGQAEIPFGQARELVLDAFGAFSPAMRDRTAPFFERRWIDAELRPGKRGGAFCNYSGPGRHPYVFMNYTGRARDVMTLAHELGHALHGEFAEQHHYFDYFPTLPIGETASVFGEMLVFERLQAQIEDPRERLALLAGKLEDTFATVFRQVTMYRFEQAAHARRRAEGELTTETYNALWQQTMQEMFGSSLRLTEGHAYWWLFVPHFFHSPFYVYAYAFGELLVFPLYARYKQEGKPFVGRYLDLLALGGSRKPELALGDFGIDVRDPAFWRGGVNLIREMVRQAEDLARTLH